MIKKIVAVLVSMFLAAFMLTACSQPEKQKDPKDESTLVFDKKLENGIQLQVYRIAEGKLSASQAEIMTKHKEGDPIIAVRYVLTNTTESPIDIRNVTLWNANFKNSPNGVGSFNFSDTSLHKDLGYSTLPEEFVLSNKEQWILEPGKSTQFAYDWIIDSKDLLMDYYIVFSGDKNIYKAEVNLKKP